MKVGIVGLGLIGGSLARDLSARGHTVVGFDRSAATLRSARRSAAIALAGSKDFTELTNCDVCVMAVPVTAAPGILSRALYALVDVPLITDVGSTKRSIVRAAERLGLGPRFVGAHPLAGDTNAGWHASRRNLFSDAPVFLTPTRSTQPATLARARKFWRLVGAKPQVITAADHDNLLAGASHLPQIVSSALGLTLQQVGISRSALGPGGRDMTRLAGADVEVWRAIALDNADRLVPMLRRYERTLRRARGVIQSGNATALRALFRAAGTWSRAQ